MNRRDFNTSAGQAALGLALASVQSSVATSAPAPKAKIKIGQIGTAHGHAAGKLETILKFPDLYELVGVVEPDERRRDQAKARPPYDMVRWLSEEQLFSTPGLQAVDVETAVPELVPTAARAVAAGMHVHLDKPPGLSLAALKRLLSDATSRGLTVQLGYMLRYNPAFQLCFQAVREGWLGEVFEVHGVMSKALNEAGRQKLLAYPGGSMFELGCHLIDPLVTLLGRPQKITAYPRQTLSDGLADNGLAVFEYPRATATIRSSLVEVDGGHRRQFIVCGTGGTLEIMPLEAPQAVLTLTGPRGSYRKGRQPVSFAKMPGRYDQEFISLAAAIRGEKPLDWTPQHDLLVHECVLRASGLRLDA